MSEFPFITRKEMLEAHKVITGEAYALCEEKNDDYAGADEAYGNLRVCEDWDIATVEAGLLIRMADKMRRLATLIHGKEPSVKNEKMEDSLKDIINYAVFFIKALRMRAEGPKAERIVTRYFIDGIEQDPED